MSRVDYNDDGDTEAILAMGRWQRNTVTTVASRRGQAALRELEAALLALPEPRLAYETFCAVTLDEQGREHVDACTLGARTWHRGRAGEVPLEFNDPDYHDYLPEAPSPLYDATASDEAEWVEKNLGLTYTLAWNIIEANDETFQRATPEQRWVLMLGWIRERLN